MAGKGLITGSDGQLGRELRSLENKYNSLSFIFTDLGDLDITNTVQLRSFINKHKPDFLINCAGYTAVDRAEEEPDLAMKLNADAVQNIVDAIANTNCRLIHISTDYVLNGRTDKALKETAIPNPESVYALTKLKGEQAALTLSSSIVIRTSWLYSSYGKNFVKTILRLSLEKERIQVVNDQIGTPTYAADLAAAILEIITGISANPDSSDGGVYHYSNTGLCSWYEFALKIKELKGLDLEIVPVTSDQYPLPAKRPPFSVLDKEKITKYFSISIPDWANSLDKCLQLLD